MKRTNRRFQAPFSPPRLVPRSSAAPAMPAPVSFARRLAALVRWPFASRWASPLWLAVRLYLGVFWLQMGIAKLQGGWLTTNPMETMFRAIAEGYTAAPFAFYRGVAQVLLDLSMAPVISVSFPFLEIAIGLAFISGVLVVPAAMGAILMNTNLILSGIASLGFDLRFIALQLLLIVAWRVSSTIGIQSLLVRGYRVVRSQLRAPAAPQPCTAC